MQIEELQQPKQSTDRIFDKAIFALLVMFLFCSAFSIALSEIGYFSALAFWAGKMMYTRRLSIPRTPFDLFFLGYIGSEILATIFAHDKAYSLLYLQRRLLLLPIVYIIFGNIRSRRDLELLFGALILSAVAVALWSMKDILVHFSEYLHFNRRLSEFQHYMTAGGITMIGLLLLLPFVVHKRTPHKYRLLALSFTLPLAVNLFFTFTRSSWLGFLAGTVYIGAVRTRRLFLPVFIVSLMVLFLATPEIRERIYSVIDPNHPANVARVHMWMTGVKIFIDHPIVGIGDVGTETVWNQYAQPGWEPEGHLHNNIIMWVVTLGLVGLVVLVALFVRIWLVMSQIEKKLRDHWFHGSLALGGLAVLVGFHVNGLFEWNFGDAEIISLVWAILGLILAAEKISPRANDQ